MDIAFLLLLPIVAIPLNLVFFIYLLVRYLYRRFHFTRMDPGTFKKVGQEVPPAPPWVVWAVLIAVIVLAAVLVVYFWGAAIWEIFFPVEIEYVEKMTIREQVSIAGADKQTMDIEILDKDLKTIGSDKLTSPNYVATFEELDVPGGYFWLRVYATGVYWLPGETADLRPLNSTEVGEVTYYKLTVAEATFSVDVYIAKRMSISVVECENRTSIANGTQSVFSTTIKMNITTPESLLQGVNFTITADAVAWNASRIDVFGEVVDFTIQVDDGDDIWETDETLVAELGDVINEEETSVFKWAGITWQGAGTSTIENVTVTLRYINEKGESKAMYSHALTLSNFA